MLSCYILETAPLYVLLGTLINFYFSKNEYAGSLPMACLPSTNLPPLFGTEPIHVNFSKAHLFPKSSNQKSIKKAGMIGHEK